MAASELVSVCVSVGGGGVYGGGVATPSHEETGAVGENGDEIDAWNTATGAFDNFSVTAEYDCRFSVRPRQLAGHDADDAMVPVVAVDHDAEAICPTFVGLAFGFSGDAPFDVSSLFVELVEFTRKFTAFRKIVAA